MLQVVVLLAAGIAIALAAYRFGADSRDGLDWRPQRGDCTPRCN